MRFGRPSLADITITCFGLHLGQELLDQGAVHPILGIDRKTPGYAGHNLPWRDPGTTKFVALGFTAGQLSGITAWDFDSKRFDLPVAPNVLTARGSHIYTPYAGEKHLQPGVDDMDVLSNSNVVFWTDDGSKQFTHPGLAEPGMLHAFWRELSGKSIVLTPRDRTGTHLPTRKEGTSTCASPSSEPRPAAGWLSGYEEEVRERGWALDLVSIAKGCLLRVQRAKAGRRNIVLHRQAREMVRCGLDPWDLEPAALGTGLKPDEVEQVIRRAISTFDPTLPSVLTRVDEWVNAARPRVHRRLHPLLDELARMAVEQNTIAPMVNQNDVNDVVGRTTTSRRLTQLGKRNLVHKRPMGYRAGGLRRSNCYQLCMRITANFASTPCDCQLPPRRAIVWPDRWDRSLGQFSFTVEWRDVE